MSPNADSVSHPISLINCANSVKWFFSFNPASFRNRLNISYIIGPKVCSVKKSPFKSKKETSHSLLGAWSANEFKLFIFFPPPCGCLNEWYSRHPSSISWHWWQWMQSVICTLPSINLMQPLWQFVSQTLQVPQYVAFLNTCLNNLLNLGFSFNTLSFIETT